MQNGLLMIYTHHVTTPSYVALGLALRALGRGWRVSIIHFTRDFECLCEVAKSSRLESSLKCRAFGSADRSVGRSAANDEAAQVTAAWQSARRAIESRAFQLVVLDELMDPLSRGLLDLDQVVQFFKERPRDVTILITGPDLPELLLEAADLVTNMVDVTP